MNDKLVCIQHAATLQFACEPLAASFAANGSPLICLWANHLRIIAMTENASCRMPLRVLGSLQLGNWAQGTSDRVWQDKSRKVRSVGWVRNSAKFSLVQNIARVSRNLRSSATNYRPTTFYTLQSER
jgi:hypothetical protein